MVEPGNCRSHLAGYASVILVMLMGQSRVFFSMSKDGLIPKIFSSVNPKTQTPAKNNLLFMLFVSFLLHLFLQELLVK